MNGLRMDPDPFRVRDEGLALTCRVSIQDLQRTATLGMVKTTVLAQNQPNDSTSFYLKA